MPDSPVMEHLEAKVCSSKEWTGSCIDWNRHEKYLTDEFWTNFWKEDKNTASSLLWILFAQHFLRGIESQCCWSLLFHECGFMRVDQHCCTSWNLLQLTCIQLSHVTFTESFRALDIPKCGYQRMRQDLTSARLREMEPAVTAAAEVPGC